MKRKGILTVVSGFSGAGKGTVMKALMAEYKDTYLCIICFSYHEKSETRRSGWC